MSWAGKNNAKITAQFTAGGSAKSGLGRHIGMNPFVQIAIANRAPNVSGIFWRNVFNTQYPVPAINQMGGVAMTRFSQTRAPADGVNINAINAARARIAAGPPGWGLF